MHHISDPRMLRLLHRHGDRWDDISVMEHHDSAAHDPERSWLTGAKVYRCEACDEEFTVVEGNVVGEHRQDR